MSNRYVQFEKVGGPEVLTVKTEDIPTPGEGEIVVKNEAIGFNLIDTYFRKGIYPVELPSRVGGEGAGFVHGVGKGVSNFKKGERVTYLGPGATADYTKVKASNATSLPDAISFDVAAGSLLKGLTVQYLIEKIYEPKKDEIVLFHAGAGGVGLLFLQWARSLGAKVITTVSTDEKAKLAKENGAWEVLKYSDDIPSKVKELTGGKKVKVVYDSVGKSTFDGSLDSLAPRGLLISYGNASGVVPPFAITALSAKGSLFLTRPTLYAYLDDLPAQAAAFFKLVADGTIKVHVNQAYKLEDIKQLHADAESRKTTGSTVLHP